MRRGTGPEGRRFARLAKLVALAADQHGTPEGDIARARAEALAAELGVSAELDPLVIETFEGPATEWGYILLTAASMLAGGHHAFASGRRSGTFAGRRSSWLLFEHLQAYFLDQHRRRRRVFMDLALQRWTAGDYRLRRPGRATKAHRRKALREAGAGYSLGFAKAIYAQAIRLYDSGWKRAECDQAREGLAAVFKLGTRAVSKGGLGEGWADGAKVAISRPVDGATPAPAHALGADAGRQWRGHPIAEGTDGVWRYVDTGTPVPDEVDRPCGHCGRGNTPEGHDGCLGTLPGVMNACCGHGDDSDAYVQLPDGRCLRGANAVRWIRDAGGAS